MTFISLSEFRISIANTKRPASFNTNINGFGIWERPSYKMPPFTWEARRSRSLMGRIFWQRPWSTMIRIHSRNGEFWWEMFLNSQLLPWESGQHLQLDILLFVRIHRSPWAHSPIARRSLARIYMCLYHSGFRIRHHRLFL